MNKHAPKYKETKGSVEFDERKVDLKSKRLVTKPYEMAEKSNFHSLPGWHVKNCMLTIGIEFLLAMVCWLSNFLTSKIKSKKDSTVLLR